VNSFTKFAVAVCLAGVLWTMSRQGRPELSGSPLTYSQFIHAVRSGEVDRVIVFENVQGIPHANSHSKDGRSLHTMLPSDYRDALVAIEEAHASVEIRDSSWDIPRILSRTGPFLLLLSVWGILLGVRKLRPSGARQEWAG
jgi:ATP-dependent Zn protease